MGTNLANQTLTAVSLSSPEPEATSTQKAKITRSEKQSEADQGQAKMLEELRVMYAEEFADVPEKFRPKAKAWVARAAYYKDSDQEREKYIQSMIIADRNATDARMGRKAHKKHIQPSSSNSNSYNGNTNSNSNMNNSNVISLTKKVHLTGVANPLREQASRSEKKLVEVVTKSEKSMLARARTPSDRVAIRRFATETRKVARDLGRGARSAATVLERVAKQRLREEAKIVLARNGYKIRTMKTNSSNSGMKVNSRKRTIMPLRTGNRSRNLNKNNNTSVNLYNNSNSVSTSGLKNMNANTSERSLNDPYANKRSGVVNNRSGNRSENRSEAGQSVNTSIKSGRSFKDPYANSRSVLNNRSGSINSSSLTNSTQTASLNAV